jgi:hypothetical protein
LKPATAAALVLVAAMFPQAGMVWADGHVAMRGQYYREPSTRVVQPVIEVAKDLPAGFDVSAHYLLDAITSASAASGPSGDNIFTEYRNESGLAVGKSWSRIRVGAAYRYSAESDYWSHSFMLSAALRTWGDTGTLALSAGIGFDQVGRRTAPNAFTPAGAVCPAAGTCPLDSRFGGIGYSQVLSPTLLVQAGYELVWLDGYLGSPYRAVTLLPGQVLPEMAPNNRVRNAVSARAAKYFRRTGTGLQLHYRYYFDLYAGGMSYPNGDPWKLRSHTVEMRLFQMLSSDLELRLTGRYYSQGAANFWCDQGGNPSCYVGAQIYTSEPQLTPFRTTFLEAKLYWEAIRWRDLPFLGWFAAGTFELSYGRFLQSTKTFGTAHVVQTGYSLPF